MKKYKWEYKAPLKTEKLGEIDTCVVVPGALVTESQTDECAKEYEELGLRKLKELRKERKIDGNIS